MCEVTAEPAPSVDWFKEGNPVSTIGTSYFKDLIMRNLRRNNTWWAFDLNSFSPSIWLSHSLTSHLATKYVLALNRRLLIPSKPYPALNFYDDLLCVFLL